MVGLDEAVVGIKGVRWDTKGEHARPGGRSGLSWGGSKRGRRVSRKSGSKSRSAVKADVLPSWDGSCMRMGSAKRSGGVAVVGSLKVPTALSVSVSSGGRDRGQYPGHQHVDYCLEHHFHLRSRSC